MTWMVEKPGQVSLATSSAQSNRLRIHFKPWSHRHIYIHESVGLLTLAHTGSAIVSDDDAGALACWW